MSGNSFVQNATRRAVKYIKPVPRGEAKCRSDSSVLG